MKRPIHHRPAIIARVATFSIIPVNGWYLCNDGNIWYITMTSWGNDGPPAYFVEHNKDNKRVVWEPGYPDKLLAN